MVAIVCSITVSPATISDATTRTGQRDSYPYMSWGVGFADFDNYTSVEPRARGSRVCKVDLVEANQSSHTGVACEHDEACADARLRAARARVLSARFDRRQERAGEALVGAYRHYVGICQPPHRISFDRAFDLAAHTDGLWLTDARSLSLVTCPTCHSEFLAAYGSVALSNDHCPFCKLVQRYGTDPRVQGAFPVQPLAAPSAEQLGMLVLLRRATGTTTSQVAPSSPGERRP